MLYNKLKFKSRLLLPIIFSIIILVSITQYLIYNVSSKVILEKAKNEMFIQVSEVKNLINLQFKSNKDYADALAENSYIVNCLASPNTDTITRAKEYILNLMNSHPEYDSILLCNKKGISIVANSDKFTGIDLSSREYFKTALTGKTNISNVIRSKVTGKPIYIVCAPVIYDGKVIGTFQISERMDNINKNYIKPVKIGKTGYAFIFDKDGILLSHPNNEIVLNEKFAKNNPAAKMAINASPKSVRYWWERSKQYKHMIGIPTDKEWYISIAVPEDELLEVLDPIKFISLIGGILLVLITSLVVLLVVSPVAKIMVAVNDTIINLSNGDIRELPEHTKTLSKALSRNDEIGMISIASNQIQQYFNHMSEIALKIASKDLTITPNVKGVNDVLGNAFLTMIKEFSNAISHVNKTVENVNKGASHLSAASQALSSGATEQAASIEEISSSISELGTQTKHNADNASQANQLANEANSAAIQGKEQMGELSSAMNNISNRAEETQKVIKTIDDIAFQTNLLALNAAVEAARAGTHGKGFAVVAEEVRNLAARSAKAAGETAELIENMVKDIHDGNAMTNTTEESLNNIAEHIDKSTQLIAEIAEASQSQAEGVLQIDIGLKQVGDVTQSNTANAEETASSSEQMLSVSSSLKNIVNEFVLNSNDKQNLKTENNIQRTSQAKIANPSTEDSSVVYPQDSIDLDDSEFGKF